MKSARRRAGRLRRRLLDLVGTGAAIPSVSGTGGTTGGSTEELDGLGVLLPSLGLFGGIDANHLKVLVDERLTGLLLMIPADAPGQLDLRGVHFFRHGDRVEVDLGDVRARQSSYASASLDAAGALSLRGIRTSEEAGPWWMASFDPPLDVDEIRVLNRMDGKGVHNRRIHVFVPGDEGHWRLREDASSAQHVDATLALLTRLTQVQIPPAALTHPVAMRRLRAQVLRGLAERARTAPLTVEAEEQRLLFALLPSVPPDPGAQLTDDEWTLLAHLLVAERKRMRRSATSFRLFSQVLTTRASLERLHSEINLAAPVFGLDRMSLTRHGLREMGQLRQEADVHVALMRTVQEEFASLGLPIMLGYGTLLGAVREGDFLEHDDDVDLMYPVEAKTAKQARAHADRLCAALVARGFRIWRNESQTSLNFHVTDPRTGCHVDVFPVLLHGEVATLHMERMKLRSIPQHLVVPARPLSFRSAELLGPADPEGFLEERYGPSWSVPDPYHDWIWPLQS